MKVRSLIAAGAATFLVCATPALAEEESWLPGEFSGNVATYSDYSFRGISQTGRNIALQGGIDWSIDTPIDGIGFYTGIWGSTIDFDEAYLEQDLYFGLSGEIGSLSWDVGTIFFYYAKEETLNYWEVPASLSYDFDVFSLTGGVMWSPDYFGELSDGWYLSSGIEVPLPLEIPGVELTLDANFGYTNARGIVRSGNEYIDYSAGMVVGLPKGLGLDLRMVGTDATSTYGSKAAGDRFVAGLTYSF